MNRIQWNDPVPRAAGAGRRATARRRFLVAAFACFVSPAIAESPEPKSPEEIRVLADRYCGNCHKVPSPALLPKHSWPAVIDTMVDLAEERTGQPMIPAEAVPHIKALYYGSSPEALPRLPHIERRPGEPGWASRRVGSGSALPQTLNIQPADLGRDTELSFLVSDGERGQVRLLEAERGETLNWRETPLADIRLPIQTRVVDYNGNGRADIVVADLGELPPSSRRAGKIHLLEQNGQGDFEKRLLADGLGRISDLRVRDINDDGRLDLAVAVFGGDGHGSVLWLENRGDEGFERHQWLGMSGALNIVPVDLNDDGRLDWVTLIAQEHEVVVALINRGDGRYQRRELARAPHPMYGFTQLQVVDLDRDGRPDLLMTNGDAFDTQNDPKPYHGVQWLRNRGALAFEYRDVGRFYGAAKAAVGDINGDGHLDVVASSWVNHWDDDKRQSMVWFENDGEQNFTPRALAGNQKGLVPVVIRDLDGDGRQDILTGAFRMDLLREVMVNGADSSRPDNKAPDRKVPRLMWFRQTRAGSQ